MTSAATSLSLYEAGVILEWPADAVIAGFCDGMSAESPEVRALGYSESEATVALAVNLEDFAVDLEQLAAQARRVAQRLKAMRDRGSSVCGQPTEGTLKP